MERAISTTEPKNILRPVAMALQGKGLLGMMRRASAIVSHYGLTPSKMDYLLHDYVEILHHFNCSATFPVTAIALARNKGVVEKYQSQKIEFAVHGYYHVDHARLSFDEQSSQISRARRLFREQGVAGEGFRCPYLRWSPDTMKAIAQNGFLYDSSQGVYWNVVGKRETESYRQVLKFYGAISAGDYPALPRLNSTVVRIPYSLPDDESLIDRLHLEASVTTENPWLKILFESARLGELFALGLHPERIHLCQAWLIDVLEHARSITPRVWIARLDEVARWWRARMDTHICIAQQAEDCYHVEANGPEGITFLSRGVRLLSPASEWDGHYQSIRGTKVDFKADCRPFIGVSQRSDPCLSSFLRQQGYIIESGSASSSNHYGHYLDRPLFKPEDERALLSQIENSNVPLLRLGRWPNRAKSALVVTGDIDALTIWDYALRLLGA